MIGVSLFTILTRAIFRETSLSSLDINFWRYLAATPLMWLLIFTALSHAAPPTADPQPTVASTTPNRWALIALGVLFAIYSVITAIALEYIIAGLFGILFYAFYPTMVALLSLALGERLPRMFWLVLLGTTFGLILVLSPGLLGAVGIKGGAIGVVFTLVSAFLNACYILLSRRVLRDTQQVPRAVGWTLVGAFLSLAAMVVFTGVRTPNGRDIAFIMGIVLFGTLLPRVAFYLGLQRLGAPRAALISTATPFVTVVLGVLTLNEFLTVSQLIGGALILASMIVLARTSAPQEQPAAPPQNVQFSTARP